MKNLKTYNESFMDIFNGNFNKKSKGFFDQFKKGYAERTKAENILVECLYYLDISFRQGVNESRLLGAMESVLLLENVLKGGEKFKFEEKQMKFLFIEYKSKENYREHIIRLSWEYLKNNDVL